LFVKYTKSNYNELVKLNSLSLIDIAPLIDTNTNINEKILEDANIDSMINNIISWQFGMYQERYPKVIKTSTIGFWSKRECNFLQPYTGKANSYPTKNGQITYNYGSLQDGTGVFIKLIIDYYLKNKDLNNYLVSDCFTSINLFIDYLNKMIYDNGGIPEYFPLQGYQFDNICLNDGAFMNYLRCCDFILNTEIKNEINENKINLLKQNYNKALDCILDLQITVNGKKTIWAQQYDPVTLLPTSARSFEKKSLCSLESAQLLIYLMSLPEPDSKMKTAIYDGCNWFQENAISNYKQVIDNGEVSIVKNLNNKRNLYSRYYELENGFPIFFDRGGNNYNLDTFNDIPIQMRNGYTWLGCWGDYLLEIYTFWKIIFSDE
jgi:pectate lyase